MEKRKSHIMKRKNFLVLFGLIAVLQLNAQPLYINPMQYTPQELVEDILVTGCLQAYNVTYTGDPLSKGYFQTTANPSNFLFESGVVMSSGYVLQVMGPNNSGSTSQNTSGPSDPNLNALIPQSTNDAAVLEFDFIPADNTIAFNYSFGSEEYLEWVNSSFNDVFAFFLTGPNPVGAPYVNVNIATIPGTTIPVSINNVNNVANSAYYINNGTGSSPGNEAVEFDGYTVAMTATANVTPCETYHIKLAVADAGDSVYDSGVFLEAGSLVSGEVVSMTNYGSNGTATNQIIEGCENYYIFYRTDTTDTTQPLDVMLNISGTASTATDISGFPLTFQIPVGQVSDTIFYSAILDNITEGTEMLIFTLLNGCPCSITGTNDTIFVVDNVTLAGGVLNNDTLICSPQSQTFQISAWATTAPNITSYYWSTGATSQTITISPPTGAITTYSVTISDECGQIVTDDIDVTVSNMSTVNITVEDLICNSVCTGSVTVNPNTGFAPYTFSWTPGGLGQATIGLAENLCAGNYQVTVTDAFGCSTPSSFTVSEPPALQLSFTADSATCPGASDGALHVSVANGNSPFLYNCSTQQPVPGVPSSNFTFNNMQAGNYTVNVTDGNGCIATGIFSIGEMQLSYSTSVQDVKCYGESTGDAQISINGGTAPYNYSWSHGGVTDTLNNVPAGNYSCTVVDDHGCMILVPVTVNQPDRLILTNSLDTLMCLGEIVQLQAVGQGGTTPYTFNWYEGTSLIGSGSPIDYSPGETQTVSVELVDANNCVDGPHEVLVEIYPKVSINFYTNTDSICKGESTYLYANVYGGNGGPYTISDDAGASVSLPLLVSPETTTSYTIYADDDCGSPQGVGTITIHVMDPPAGNFYSEDSVGCAPFLVKFHETTADNGQSYLWDFGAISEHAYSLKKNPEFEFTTAGLYDIALTVSSEFGCSTTVYSPEMIEVLPQPSAEVLPDPPSTSILHPVVHFANESDYDLVQATIDFGDGHSLLLTTDIFEDVQYVYTDTGTYNVMLIVENQKGCLDTAYTKVEVFTEHNGMQAPNAINPYSTNSENRVFLPKGLGIDASEYHLIIYDRWGSKVFESFNLSHGWDGRINNGEVGKPDTYPWVVIYKDKYGKTHRVAGTVTLVY